MNQITITRNNRLVLLAVAALTTFLAATVYACQGAQGCTGADVLGPEGNSWQSDPCQNIPSTYSGSCPGGTTWEVSGLSSVRRTYFPTRVCAPAEPGCTNIAGYKCFEMEFFDGPNCTGNSAGIFSCPKDYACQGTPSDPL